MNTKRRLAILAAPAVLAIAAGVFVAGHAVGSNTYDARSTSYSAGYDKARYDFCNLKLGADQASLLDSRRVPGLDDSLVVADASCEDWQIEAWNSAQE